MNTVTLRRKSGDAGLNAHVLAVCCDAVEACARVIGADPPLGRKPYVIQQAPDNVPRACLDGLPAEYVVDVTCLHDRLYCQLAFQVGHELGHFYLDPYRTGPFAEAVCTAISLLCLEALAAKWASAPPFASWTTYAPEFTSYRLQVVEDACAGVGIGRNGDILAWIGTTLPGIVAAGRFDRPHEAVCANVIAGIMRTYPGSCSAVTKIGAACRPSGAMDFALWRCAGSADETALVDHLSTVFAPVFDVRG